MVSIAEEIHGDHVQQICSETPALKIYLAVLFEVAALEETESTLPIAGIRMIPFERQSDQGILVERS